MTEIKRVIYACDIGSTLYQKKRGGPAFGWARLNPNEGTKSIRGSSDIQQLVEQLQLDIEVGYSVSLGFESPLFIPIPENPEELSKKREGEGDRSWSAPPGAAVTTLGIHQSAWILKRLRKSSSGKCKFTLDWKCWPPTSHQHILFCWEAFVSGKDAHSTDDMRDAATAVVFFFENERKLVNAVTVEKPISLIGAVALWSGWTNDLKYLHDKTTLVLKPNSIFEGDIQKL
jgi:hypothetical protein